ncbi:MAG: DUF58 domain-containing protein [Planctomycetota bacterium]|nr:DUF58 domain-containing protein [Planctomycetota bacterium]
MATIPLDSASTKDRDSVASDARPTTRLTREGYQFVFMLMFVWLAAILQNVNLLVLLSGAFSAMLLIQWRIASATLAGLSAQRFVPYGVEARKPFVVLVTVTNPRRWLASWLLMIHENFVLQSSSRGLWQPGQGLTLFVKRLLPQKSNETSYNCIAPRRGAYRFQQMELSTRFPLALMRGRVSGCGSQTVIVRPTVGTLTADWRKHLGIPQHGQTRRASAMSGGDGEFYGLRSYRPGDTYRWIHWRTSAKRNELLVRQFERDEKQSMVTILDLHQEGKSAIKSDLVDLAVELFATLISHVVQKDRMHALVSVLDQQGTPLFDVKSAHQLNPVLDRLALASPNKNDLLADNLKSVSLRNSLNEPILVVSIRAKPDWLVAADPAIANATSNNQIAATQPISISTNPSFFRNLRWINVNDETWKHLFERGQIVAG